MKLRSSVYLVKVYPEVTESKSIYQSPGHSATFLPKSSLCLWPLPYLRLPIQVICRHLAPFLCHSQLSPVTLPLFAKKSSLPCPLPLPPLTPPGDLPQFGTVLGHRCLSPATLPRFDLRSSSHYPFPSPPPTPHPPSDLSITTSCLDLNIVPCYCYSE